MPPFLLGELTRLTCKIVIADYDPQWPERFRCEAAKVKSALGSRALAIEHIGSTAVPDLSAKPVIDILLVVENSAEEDAYSPALEKAGFTLTIREPEWHQHRMFKGQQVDVNLHVFSSGCAEIDRVLLLRDWLRKHADDRNLYAREKLKLAQQEWDKVQSYADAKTVVIAQILERARKGRELQLRRPCGAG